MEKHADLPWHIEEMHGPDNELCFEAFKDAHDGFVASTFAGSRPADATFIVKACNNHYQLLEALKEARGQILEVCGAARIPLPEASIIRYDSLIKQAESDND